MARAAQLPVKETFVLAEHHQRFEPRITLVSWKGWNGDTVEGILGLPPDYTPGPPHGGLPMIVELHGGPTAASLLRFRFWIYGRVL